MFWLALLSSIFYETLLANKMLFLPQTPTIVPLVLFALSLIWLVSYGLVPMIRFFQLLLPFLAIPLILLALLFTTTIKTDRFLPVQENGLLPVLKGSYYSLGAFQGPEVLLEDIARRENFRDLTNYLLREPDLALRLRLVFVQHAQARDFFYTNPRFEKRVAGDTVTSEGMMMEEAGKDLDFSEPENLKKWKNSLMTQLVNK
ncbi:GerAB/ArcD/ProY family transporter [Desulfosporosinus sp. BICA1-9]|uniref:GerAB/ArcD/ProY family transporter n=1 Tax=Desulfosporosinus sp. BICA1-9 TaxID=1531958 RepID=UPI0025B89208|nr:GerAB/ArcD/ProY family transporter [Desulfosporosinus sp. BICA1-9]